MHLQGLALLDPDSPLLFNFRFVDLGVFQSRVITAAARLHHAMDGQEIPHLHLAFLEALSPDFLNVPFFIYFHRMSSGLFTISTMFFIGIVSVFSQAPVTDFQKLVWSDEFNYTGLPDSTKWRYDMGDGCPNLCGWGNQELEYYTSRPENARVENGSLIIEARKEEYAGSQYTSARLVSRGKGEWKYGRIEVRAKLPSGRGVWPAIWMLPVTHRYGGWPADGEIDIMEHVGYEPNHVYGSVHTKTYNHIDGTQRTAGFMEFDNPFQQHFHTYVIDWTEERIAFLIDDIPYFTFPNEQATYAEWPFDAPFYLIMNIAVGGRSGGYRRQHLAPEDGSGLRAGVSVISRFIT
jgi:beta-glucanase (GH16 family)